MMLLTATVACFDVLDAVWIRANVRERAHDDETARPPALTCEISVPGEGISDPREWLRDALVALLEAL